MRKNVKYTPVSCDLIDQIEIFATRRKRVQLTYREGDSEICGSIIIKTWFTKDKIEYLESTDGLVVRLDEVVSIDGILNSCVCSI